MPRVGFSASRFDLDQIGKATGSSVMQSLGITLSPQFAGAEEITQPYVESWVVHACARLIAEKVSAIPLRVYAGPGEDAQEITDGPIVKLLRNPNVKSSWADVAFADMVHLALSGESFWFLVDRMGRPWDGKGLPPQIVPVNGSAVQDHRDDYGMVQQWSYASTGAKAGAPWFTNSQVVHFWEYDPSDPERGLGPAEVASRKLSAEFQIERYMDATTRAGGPGAFIVYEDQIGPDEQARLQAQIDAQRDDPDRAGGMRVLTRGAKVTPNPTKPVDMGLLDQLRYVRNVVCSIMRVPPPCIGILEDAKYANMGEAWSQFWLSRADDLRRYQQKITAGLLGKLTGPESQYVIRFDTSGISELQRDTSGKITQALEIARSDVGPTFGQSLQIVGVPVDEKLLVPPASGDEAASAVETNVQEQAMNGAQVASLVDIATQVGDGSLDPEAAIGILLVAYPNVDEAEARRIVSNAAKARPDEEDPEANMLEDSDTADAEDDPTEDAADSADSADAADTSKSARREPRCSVHRDLTAPERRAYWEEWNRRVFVRGERPLRIAVRGWMRSLELAQIKHLREFAGGAKSTAAPVAKEFSELDIQEVIFDRDRWAKLLDKSVGSTIRDTFRRSLRELASELGTRAIPMSDPRVIEALRVQRVQLSEGVTSTLAKQVQKRLVEVLRGASSTGDLRAAVKELLPELEGAVRQAFQSKDQRAQAIARTETAHASNTARFEQMGEDGIERHQWSAEPDDATRPEHAQLDGEVRPVGQEFGFGLRFPSDPRGSASMTINCRCVAVPVVE